MPDVFDFRSREARYGGPPPLRSCALEGFCCAIAHTILEPPGTVRAIPDNGVGLHSIGDGSRQLTLFLLNRCSDAVAIIRE